MTKKKPKKQDFCFRPINNLPEHYDFIGKLESDPTVTYYCSSRNAFSGELIMKIQRAKKTDRNKELNFSPLCSSENNRLFRKWIINPNNNLTKINPNNEKLKTLNSNQYEELYSACLNFVQYFSIPKEKREDLYKMFRNSTIAKTDKAIKDGKKLIDLYEKLNNPTYYKQFNQIKYLVSYYDRELKTFEKLKRTSSNKGFSTALSSIVKILEPLGFKRTTDIPDMITELLRIYDLFNNEDEEINFSDYCRKYI